MKFGRKKQAGGEPTPAAGRVRPDESVLDELSRAFDDDNAALIADDPDDSDSDSDPDSDGGGAAGGATRQSNASKAGRSTPVSDALGRDISADVTAPAEMDPVDDLIELSIVTSDDVGSTRQSATPTPAERRTIKIGDHFGGGDALTVDEARGRPVNLDPDPSGSSMSTPVRQVSATSPASSPAAERAASAVASGGASRSGKRTGSTSRSTIAIGGDDSLPDAVYLDGGDLGDGSEGTVFIDDDGIGDAIAAKDATAPGIEPRIRQRRISVRRAMGLRRLKWVVGGIGAALVILVVLTVLGSGLFAIDDVSVGGNVYTDKNRLDQVVDDLIGTPVLLADTEAAELALEAIPWVEAARVRAKWPSSATIEIRERTPVATMRGADGRFRVLDDEGRVLDVIEGQPVAFILLSGPGTLDLAAGEFAPIGQASAASLVTKLTPTIRPRVLSIEVTDDGANLELLLSPAENAEQTTPIQVRFGSAIGDSDQIEKLVRLENQLDDLPAGVVTEINVATNEVTVL